MEEDLKSFGRTFVAYINTVAALAAALWFVLVRFEWNPQLSANFLALVGAGVLALNVIRIVYFRSGKRREEEGPLLSHTSEGVVHVSREAVEAGLKNAGEALDEVTRLRVKVLTPGRKKTLVRAHYLAPEGTQILELSSRLRSLLVERFEQLVRLERDARVEVEMVFEGFYGKAKAKPAPEPEPEETETKTEPEPELPPPFTGPRYPIDAEGETS